MTGLRGLLRSGRRARVLAAIIVVQAFCAVFFVYDIAKDLFETGRLDLEHLIVEGIASVALVAGVIFLAFELRALLDRVGRMESGLMAARGEMAKLVEGFFDRWGLTGAERDVALLILKGYGNQDIARLRGTAGGTVRAQTSAVYAKAGVEGWAQFIGWFQEELLADGTPGGS